MTGLLRTCVRNNPAYRVEVPLVQRQLAWWIALLASAILVCSAAEGPTRSHGGQVTIPELARCRQLLVVTAADWSSVAAEMRCFERRDGSSRWSEVWPAWNAALGRTGLAWGLGLHGTGPGDGPVKREGDGKAPAGVFPLIEAFGFASAEDANTRFPYRQLTDAMEGVDDPRSRHYNRIIDAGSVAGKDWNSSERMRVQPYRWGTVVGHNWNQVPGAGSCIFLHVWEAPGVATSGCTAMAEEQMLRVVRWLDRSKTPILVQLPVEEYRRIQATWKLP
ncbi:MAG TPA: L,D-transpeptidase family protein [Chthoniobacterales bacterium]|nr:L,D-transpeptidase family protein [Chthoniobacterales bacterium]